MRKFIVLFLLLFATTFSLAQITNQLPYEIKREINRDMQVFGENYVVNKRYFVNNYGSKSEYSSIHNANSDETIVYDGKKKDFSISGNWSFVKRKGNAYHIGHALLFSNSDNVLFEISRYQTKKTRKIKSSYDQLTLLKNKFESSQLNDLVKYKLVKHDPALNYSLYKKKELNEITNEINDVYYLLGVKAFKIFNIAVFNFKETDYENMEDFIIQCYTMNR